jgi:sulfatase maturation enzyme AslB (radical SAM superfamily)
MDVTLITTHRCNLSCEYCYAGEHYKREMSPEVVERSLDLLFSDGADVAQLSFFGGEPFLAFDTMCRAIEGAKSRAAFLGREVVFQCTTNGTLLGQKQLDVIRANDIDITISLDGIQEAHDLTRRKAGGGSSFDDVCAGLRLMLDKGFSPSVMMVITPATAPFLFRSVQWLWSEGVESIKTNLAEHAKWTKEDRELLRNELKAIGRELLFRRLQGEVVRFESIDNAILQTACGGERKERLQLVVATEGNLYPCAPMVGEDRDTGPEAQLRLGHISMSPEEIIGQIKKDGAGCGEGEACACAAYLETGDRSKSGPIELWFHRVCVEISMAVEAGMAKAMPKPAKKDRRKLLQGLLLGAAGLALAGGIVASLRQQEPEVCHLRTPGQLSAPTSEPASQPQTQPTPEETTTKYPVRTGGMKFVPKSAEPQKILTKGEKRPPRSEPKKP